MLQVAHIAMLQAAMLQVATRNKVTGSNDTINATRSNEVAIGSNTTGINDTINATGSNTIGSYT